jgi:hypothetical protein
MRARRARIFGPHRGDEALAAEAGVDAHQEDEVAELQHVGDRLDRGVRVEHGAGEHAPARVVGQAADLLEVAMEVAAGLGVHGDHVGAGAREVGDVALGLLDHEVTVEGAGSERAQRLDDERADGDVGDEAAVHDVDVDPVGAGAVEGADLGAEAGEVGAEDRGGDEQGASVHARVVT